MITSKDLYEHAKASAVNPPNEVVMREAIKTAYYSVLHKIQETCESNELPKLARFNTGTHEHVIAQIAIDYSGRMIERIAKNMKKMRVKADYQLAETIQPNHVESQLKWAQECWHRLEKMTK